MQSLQGRLTVGFLFLSFLRRARTQANNQTFDLRVQQPIFTHRDVHSAISSNHTTKRYISASRKTMGNQESSGFGDDVYDKAPPPQVNFSKEELKSRLTEQEFYVTQQKGTERAFTGKYVDVKEDGSFTCVVCGTVLFKTEKKYESGSGWPSFSDVAEKGNVVKIKDTSHGMVRVEVACAKCGSHLGHVFDDGPKQDTGLRYCINSASLKFEPDSN